MLETIAFGYGLIEGPRVDQTENLFFSDVINGGVFRRASDGTMTTVVPKRRGVGGIALHADGGLVLSGKNICHVKDGPRACSSSATTSPGSTTFSPIEPDASMSARCDQTRLKREVACLVNCGGSRRQVMQVYGDVGLTNGIGFSPDGRLLYHSDSAGPHIIVHDVAPDGSVSNRRAIAQVSGGSIPDGLAVDESGCIWVAIYGGRCAARYTPDGKLDCKIDVPAKAVTSLCFGGQDQRDLYIVTADNTEAPERKGSVFRTRVEVAGLPAPLARV